jgi:AcrR family transcriptional regulator
MALLDFCGHSCTEGTAVLQSLKGILRMATRAKSLAEIEWLLSELRTKSDNVVGSKGNEKRTAILDAARDVLTDDGYAKFTLRSVALRAGVHLKTLQYYFDSKGKLLSESLNYTLENYYFNSYIQLYRGLGDMSSADALAVTVAYLLDDITDEKTGKLFFELWALGARDPEAEQALDNLYTRHRRHLELLIGRVNPRLSSDKISLRATLIAAQIEGLMLFMGAKKPRHPELEGLKDEWTARDDWSGCIVS